MFPGNDLTANISFSYRGPAATLAIRFALVQGGQEVYAAGSYVSAPLSTSWTPMSVSKTMAFSTTPSEPPVGDYDVLVQVLLQDGTLLGEQSYPAAVSVLWPYAVQNLSATLVVG
jgi:hypothetical protein